MEAVFAILLVLLSLSILVTIHELGHFWAARLFKIRVEVFSLFFPPKLFGIKRGETEYQIGSVPLGGFVKISGMIDESMDKEFLNKAPEPWEFRSKPVWQRFVVMIGGIVMNIVLGILIFSLLALVKGELKIPISNAENYPVYAGKGTLASRIGFETGDRFLTVNGSRPEYLEDAVAFNLLLRDGVYFEVERNGEKVKLQVADHLIDSAGDFRRSERGELFELAYPPRIRVPKMDSAVADFPVFQTHLKSGDSIISVDGEPVNYFNDIAYRIDKKAGKTIAITYHNGDSVVTDSVKLTLTGPDSVPRLGIMAYDTLSFTRIRYGFFPAIGRGAVRAFSVITDQISGYRKMATGNINPAKSMQGPIGIFRQLWRGFKSEGWAYFWFFTGLISMVLALANLLPIPALDGGHIVFLLIEGITGKPPSDKVKIIAQYIGMAVIILLMVFVFYNDIARWIGEK